MSLKFLHESPEVAFRKLEQDLKVTYPNLDLAKYKAASARKLDEYIDQLETKEHRIVNEGRYGSWFVDDEYLKIKLLREALEHLKEYKEIKEAKETLVSGYTYYTGTKQFGSLLEGKKCHWLGESRPHNWVAFKQNIAVAKAFEVIRHGLVEDFRQIYVGMADGRAADALVKITEKHVSESSPSALKEIEAYCNNRWTGPWPWETSSPYRLRNIIEDKEIMRKLSIQEMKTQFDDLLVQLDEGAAELGEVLMKGRDMIEKIDNMINSLGEMMGKGVLQLKDMARTALGDHAVSEIERSVAGPINQAADVLSKLKASMEKTINGLDTSSQDGGMNQGGGMDPMSGGDDMGSPQDAMGGIGGANPEDDAASQMSQGMNGVPGEDDMEDENPERPKKMR